MDGLITNNRLASIYRLPRFAAGGLANCECANKRLGAKTRKYGTHHKLKGFV